MKTILLFFFKIMEHSFFLPFIGCISAIDSQNVIDVPKKKAQIGHWTGFLSARPCDCWKFVCFMHSSVFANFNIFSKMHTQNRILCLGAFLFVCLFEHNPFLFGFIQAYVRERKKIRKFLQIEKIIIEETIDMLSHRQFFNKPIEQQQNKTKNW